MNDYYGYGLIDLRSHAAYEGLHRLLNLEYPRVGRCEWCWGPGRRAGYAVAEPGRYSLNRANWLELCNRCHIYYDGVHRPLAAPRSERELEALYARGTTRSPALAPDERFTTSASRRERSSTGPGPRFRGLTCLYALPLAVSLCAASATPGQRYWNSTSNWNWSETTLRSRRRVQPQLPRRLTLAGGSWRSARSAGASLPPLPASRWRSAWWSHCRRFGPSRHR